MSSLASLGYLQGLVTELRKLPAETGWIEFKENNSNPEEIGEYLLGTQQFGGTQWQGKCVSGVGYPGPNSRSHRYDVQAESDEEGQRELGELVGATAQPASAFSLVRI